MEASLQYDAGRGLSGFVTLFRTELTDRIARPVGATGGETENIAEALLQGIEASGRMELTPERTIRTEYTYTHSEVTTSEAQGFTEGEPLFGVPAHMVNGWVEWRPTPTLELSLGGEYRSSRHRPDHFHEPHLGGSAQGASEALGDFRSYALFDLAGTYQASERVQLRAAVENLLDRDFVDYRPYPLRNDPSTTAYSNVYNNIREPRRLSLSVSASL